MAITETNEMDVLWEGTAEEAADTLETAHFMEYPATPYGLRVALINALKKIDALEKRVNELDERTVKLKVCR